MKPNISNRYNNRTESNSRNSKTQTVDVNNNSNYYSSSYKNYGCYLVKMSQNVKNKSLSKSKHINENTNILARIKIKDKKDERHMKT